MQYPSEQDFLELLDLEAEIRDEGALAVHYTITTESSPLQVEFSFSPVTDSFQAALSHSSQLISTISSDNVLDIQITKSAQKSVICVQMKYEGMTSEATITVSPSIHMNWWTLRSS